MLVLDASDALDEVSAGALQSMQKGKCVALPHGSLCSPWAGE
jgi:hypothetical protein